MWGGERRGELCGELGMWAHTWIQQMPPKCCPSPPGHTPSCSPPEQLESQPHSFRTRRKAGDLQDSVTLRLGTRSGNVTHTPFTLCASNLSQATSSLVGKADLGRKGGLGGDWAEVGGLEVL